LCRGANRSEPSARGFGRPFRGSPTELGDLLTSRNSVSQAAIAERIGSFAPVLGVTVLVVACYLALVTSFGREAKGVDLSI
jgi:SHS family lactate transporter-like MFS transporter